ncbi:GNAT family N-acetyltransferase [Leptospira semungkisensis]|uniref:GNAT family N-acetyltransferase n=1 Tax=Leptospira semungkisensis TaxID=2484985 RepID=A0A4R9G8H6_9LEPT|nr:GNAT family N-acetyltransferase [Leptospira semungkisensis]TGK07350.1 GNAT family N-acetyltransferase [Leptospira semungkisensis]
MQKAPTIPTRIATRSDLEELSELFDLYRKFYGYESDVPAAKRFLEDRLLYKDSILLVAEGPGGLVGFAQLYPTFSSLTIQKDFILNDLYVREGERRNGIAKKLLEEATAAVIRCGGKGMGLETSPDNRTARILYEHFGFKLSESFLHYYWVAPKEA